MAGITTDVVAAIMVGITMGTVTGITEPAGSPT
jgi:hypothetical protein